MKLRFLLLACGVVATLTPPLRAAVPLMTSYQGRVRVDGANYAGAGRFKFALIASPGGASVWSNDGTSVNGSEPATAVSLAVADGLFTVLIGDSSLSNMLPLTADLFTANAGVSLRVWFDDGVNGSAQLVPDTVLASVPYALSAPVADGSITGAHLAPGAIDPGKLASVNAPAAGRVLSYDGAAFNWADPVTVASVWSLNGANAYYTGGNVGIGTTEPTARLEADGIVRATRSGVPDQYLQLDGGDPDSIRMTAQSVAGAEKSLVIRNLSGEDTPGANNSIQFALGTTESTSTRMTITRDGNVLMNPSGGDTIQFGTPAFETGMTILGANRADVRFDGSALKLLAGAGRGIPPPENGVAINAAGNVGIGTASPRNKLSVSGNADFSGDVGVGTATPGAKIEAQAAGVSGQAVRGVSTGANGFGVYGKNLSGGFAVGAEGNVTQNRDKGGFVKAMLYVDEDGSILRCYNSFLIGNAAFTGAELATTRPCGISVTRRGEGDYLIDFGFRVNDRFLSLTSEYGGFIYFRFTQNPNQVAVYRDFYFPIDGETYPGDSPFMLIIY